MLNYRYIHYTKEQRQDEQQICKTKNLLLTTQQEAVLNNYNNRGKVLICAKNESKMTSDIEIVEIGIGTLPET